MRWICLSLAAAVVALSTFAFSQNVGDATKATGDGDSVYLPASSLTFSPQNDATQSMLGAAEVHPLKLDGAPVSQVPEPSSMAVFGLLATAFLVRRRRLLLG
jgi:hypothetical protein